MTKGQESADAAAQQIQASLAEAAQRVLVAEEMLALVLNETGPVEISKNDRKPLPADVQIAVDVDSEREVITISLVSK